MDGLWNLDVRNALALIRTANECADQLARKSDADDRQTYSTIIRAKLDSLRKTIGNLELTLRDMASGSAAPSNLSERRRQLEEIRKSQQQLELALSQPGSRPFVPETPSAAPQPKLDQMSRSELYDYRNSVMRAQEEELNALDSTAGAIHSISTHIREEVDYHSGLLGDLESAMDSSQALVSHNRERLSQLIQRSSKSRLMFYIVVLTIILVLILVL
ncbi:SNARE-domain-containing protein [Babesia caballi]|uniref:SNARE-domain-containing protein n=1 Tax=Babesia caballi TaxID=5871 RepID=A0AAV4LS80_BABCB|nr:SNARE-domain-containing protein [Babesia caballi]